jgi:hypothetical protein
MADKSILSKRDKKSTKILSGWDKAIADAKRGVFRLERAIENFKEMKKAGEPWPGSPTQN